ncbi:SphA family protein [Pseudomonas veronii]|uniref:SphA family protein n=1 Tax=Pseudomonas veronii TaxID=76761 RepID=UPI002D77B171|nr:transporter [Pseudomonas veronii]WRU66430.1 transporter [Pseudomonas veronii]
MAVVQIAGSTNHSTEVSLRSDECTHFDKSNRYILATAANVMVTLALFATTAHATENGGLMYPLGVNTVAAGVYPGPGETWLQNYTAIYRSRTFTDAHGNSVVPRFKADVFVNATRIFHSWDAKVGPFELLSGTVLSLYHTRTGSDSDYERDTALGDIELQPLYFGYTSLDKTFTSYTGIDVYVPSKTDVSNNYYSFNPTTYMTWFPSPKLELSAAVGVEFHTRNRDTKYKSGTVFVTDLGMGYKPSNELPGLSIGLGGYVVSQISDDKVDGAAVNGGFRQKGYGIGPQLSYSGSWGAVAVKWQRELKTENRSEGNKFWIQFMVPFDH